MPGTEELIAERAAELRNECDERGFVHDDDLVSEQDAAALLRFENYRSLANLRYMGAIHATEKRGRHWHYGLSALAAYHLQHHRKPLMSM